MTAERVRTYNHEHMRMLARQEIARGAHAKDALRAARAKFAELQKARALMPPPPMLDH